MRWVPAALLVALTATACSGGDADPAAVAATPTPTPSSELLDSMEPPAGLRPATTSSPTAALFDWVEFVDEGSLVRTALPEGAEQTSNTVTGPDGGSIATRGYVFEHATGVIGFELIEGYATATDLSKLATFLAGSVGGAVVTLDSADVGQATGADGEIVYGDDNVMLFRVVVLNEEGDVWSAFVGGPEDDRDRLESEFTRLTLSADLRPALDWVAVIDEPSGIEVWLPGPPCPPADRRLQLADGTVVVARDRYHDDTASGFAVLDAEESVDLESLVAALTAAHGGSVLESTEPVDARGAEALDAVIVSGTWARVYRLVVVDGHILMLYAANRTDNLDTAHEVVGWLTDTVVLP